MKGLYLSSAGWGSLGSMSQLLFDGLSLIIGPDTMNVPKSIKMLLIADTVQLAQRSQYNTGLYVPVEIYLLPDIREHCYYQSAARCDFCNKAESPLLN